METLEIWQGGMASRPQLTLIHILRNRLGLTEQEYSVMLREMFSVDSDWHLNHDQAGALIDCMTDACTGYRPLQRVMCEAQF